MRIFFVAYIRTHYRALVSQAEWLRCQGNDVFFYFAAKYHGWCEDSAEAGRLGLTVVVFDGSEGGKPGMVLWRGRKEPTSIPSRSFLACCIRFRQVDRFYGRLFVRWKPDILVLPEENIAYLCNFLVSQAQKHAVPTIVQPYTIDNPCEAAETLMANRMCVVRGGMRRFFARRHPGWAFEHKASTVLRLPFPAAVLMQMMGRAPSFPWQNVCSFADAVALECEALRDQHSARGVDVSKLRVTGSHALDRLHFVKHDAQRLRHALLGELGLDRSRPVFVAAIPPDIFKSKQRKVEFANHVEVVTFWVNTLAATGWNVLVNLHPHLDPKQICLGGHSTVRLCQRPVVELLPLCDIFVACISATIRWAIACGKPVLNHDLYRYGYDDYRSAPGVVHVTSRDEFGHEVVRMTTDTAYLDKIRLAQEAVAADWGVLDGKSGERLLALFSELKNSISSPAK